MMKFTVLGKSSRPLSVFPDLPPLTCPILQLLCPELFVQTIPHGLKCLPQPILCIPLMSPCDNSSMKSLGVFSLPVKSMIPSSDSAKQFLHTSTKTLITAAMSNGQY